MLGKKGETISSRILGILDDVNYDEEQIKLIGKALIKGMIARSRQ